MRLKGECLESKKNYVISKLEKNKEEYSDLLILNEILIDLYDSKSIRTLGQYQSLVREARNIFEDRIIKEY